MRKQKERRSSQRKALENFICFSDSFEIFNPSQHVTFHVGKTVDLNANGACIITRNALEKGSKIKVTFREPTGGQMNGEVSSVIAQVKWCNKITEDFYKTGLFWPDLS